MRCSQAAQRYGGDEVLVGRADAAADGAVQWTLYTHFSSQSWSGPLAAGIDSTVDGLRRRRPRRCAQAERRVRVEVDGVSTLTDYAQRRAAAAGRTRCASRQRLEAAGANSVTFEVTACAAASQALEQALAAGSHLAERRAAGSTATHYQPQG